MPSQALNRPKAGFTMIEVVVAIGVFTLVLLVGFAGVGQMLNLQRDVYQRTVAASLIMTLGQWRAQQVTAAAKIYSLSDADWATSNILVKAVAPPAVVNTDVVFLGGTPSDYSLTSGTWFTVKPTTAEVKSGASYDPADPGQFDLSAYADLIIFKSDAQKEANDSSNYVYISVWQGARQEYLTSIAWKNRRLRFLGRYVMQDGFFP